MGKFQAYIGQDKQIVEELKNDPSLIDYFKYIITKANITANFVEPMDMDGWSLIGTIKPDRNRANDIEMILRNIADEENKYFYQWVEDNDAAPTDGDGNKILNSLTRVNVMSLLRISSGKSGPQGSSQIPTLKKQLAKQGINPDLLFPLNIDVNKQDLFEVLVNTKCMALYLDTAETEDDSAQRNMFYQFVVNEGKYIPQRTAMVDTKEITFGSTTDPMYVDYKADYRYIAALREIVVKCINDPTIISNDKIQPIKTKLQAKTGTLYFIFRSGRENVQTAEQTFSDCFLNPADSDAAKKSANQKACELPPGYKCCYYQNADLTLNGFLTSINLNEGGRGKGGYAMRADPVNNAKYKWNIAAPQLADKNLAVLLGYIMGLKKGDYLGNTALDNKYIPTNWPGDRPGSTNKVTGIQLYTYYKERKQGAPDPRIDTIPQTDIKLDELSYRKWKKGDQFQGEQTRINPYDRLNAGSIMADAVSYFWPSYKQMMNYAQGKITLSRLPATEFTKYVVMKDSKANSQWKLDNPTDPNLLFPQEWCHLFGHGDGGVEELGNFVSGSKHCNTEQLAIETGLRRVTQSSYVTQDVIDLIKVKVTAYLMPNNGVWLNEKWDEDDLLQKLFDQKPGKQQSSTKKRKKQADVPAGPTLDPVEYINKFFDEVEVDNIKEYRLKTGQDFQDPYNQLLLDIKEANRGNADLDLVGLLKFRQNLERNFFLYLPLARWIRYKIYVGNIKVFDHNYDAQRQNIDFNECQILDYSVERAIYMGMDSYNYLGETIRGKKPADGKGSDTLTLQKKDDPGGPNDYLPSHFYFNLILDRLLKSLTDQNIIDKINAIVADSSQSFLSQIARVASLIPFDA